MGMTWGMQDENDRKYGGWVVRSYRFLTFTSLHNELMMVDALADATLVREIHLDQKNLTNSIITVSIFWELNCNFGTCSALTYFPYHKGQLPTGLSLNLMFFVLNIPCC
jgi:hypothetical protein